MEDSCGAKAGDRSSHALAIEQIDDLPLGEACDLRSGRGSTPPHDAARVSDRLDQVSACEPGGAGDQDGGCERVVAHSSGLVTRTSPIFARPVIVQRVVGFEPEFVGVRVPIRLVRHVDHHGQFGADALPAVVDQIRHLDQREVLRPEEELVDGALGWRALPRVNQYRASPCPRCRRSCRPAACDNARLSRLPDTSPRRTPGQTW